MGIARGPNTRRESSGSSRRRVPSCCATWAWSSGAGSSVRSSDTRCCCATAPGPCMRAVGIGAVFTPPSGAGPRRREHAGARRDGGGARPRIRAGAPVLGHRAGVLRTARLRGAPGARLHRRLSPSSRSVARSRCGSRGSATRTGSSPGSRPRGRQTHPTWLRPARSPALFRYFCHRNHIGRVWILSAPRPRRWLPHGGARRSVARPARSARAEALLVRRGRRARRAQGACMGDRAGAREEGARGASSGVARPRRRSGGGFASSGGRPRSR